MGLGFTETKEGVSFDHYLVKLTHEVLWQIYEMEWQMKFCNVTNKLCIGSSLCRFYILCLDVANETFRFNRHDATQLRKDWPATHCSSIGQQSDSHFGVKSFDVGHKLREYRHLEVY